ncbi:hypothetical protein SDJN02_10895, partial [Cucurbita argyrosperma subsp. argyrosperma]
VQEMATLLFYIYFFMSLMLRDAQTTTIENHHPRNHAMILGVSGLISNSGL